MTQLLVSDLVVSPRAARSQLGKVSLEVGPREIVALIGPNGSGKTSVLEALAGFLECRASAMMLDGRSILHLSPESRSARGLVYLPHAPNIVPRLTVRQNLQLGGWRARHQELDWVLDVVAPLRDCLDSEARSLGRFKHQLCAIGRCLMARPRLLLLDEPLRGLSPEESARMLRLLPDLSAANAVSLVVADHDAETVLAAADRSYVMSRGSVVCSGGLSEVLADPGFLALYGRTGQ